MAKTADLRNVGILGHGGTGKTTVVSACLFAAGAVNRLGRVEQGTAVTDFDDEEIARQISIQSAMAHCDWDDLHLTFVDTPGYNVFRADTKASVRVCDGAVVVVDSVSGAEVMTEKVWEYADEYRTPTLVTINRLDRENSSFERAVESCTDLFGREVMPLQLPIGEAHNFRGVVDLVEMKAYEYENDGNGKGTPSDIPDDLLAAADAAREALVEMVAESDEELMEAYFEESSLTDEQLVAGITKAVRSRRLYPVLCLSAAHNIGTDRVLDAISCFLPSPVDRPQLLGIGDDGKPVWGNIAPEGSFEALVFKTVADPFAGRISLIKVFSGSAVADAPVVNSRTGRTEKLANLSTVQGKSYNALSKAVSGQLCALAKLRDTTTGDTLRDKSSTTALWHIDYPTAAISFAVEPGSKGDEDKISQSLARLLEEDPTLRVERDAQTGELLLSGLGQLHVEVTVARMRRRFGVGTTLKPPKVPYRETIRRTAEAEGRHKKQSGGRGQFGVAKVVLSPLPTGSGFEFEDKIFGGSISQQFRPAVQKGIVEAAQRGVLAGFPLVDFKATLVDGKEHSVDSSEIAFKIAGSLAFKEAAAHAAPVLLEPIMTLDVNVPDDSMGDIIGDLNGRRGRVQGMDPRKGRQIVKAQVPLAEVLSYAMDLNALTGGRGTYTIEFSHYEDVPATVGQRIVESVRAAAQQET